MTYVIPANEQFQYKNSAQDIIDRSIKKTSVVTPATPEGNAKKFASIGSVGNGMQKVAFSSISQGNTIYGAPNFYSPIHTAVNWQIPTKRREVYQWRTTKNTELMKEDFTFVKFENYDFIPESVVQDTITDGKVFENIKSEYIYGGQSELRHPINLFKITDYKEDYLNIETNGFYKKLEIHPEHEIYVIKAKQLRKEIKLYKQEIKDKYDKRKFIEDNNWEIEKIKSKNLNIDDFLLTPIPKIKNKNYFPEYDNDFFYFIGCMASESTINTTKKYNNVKKFIINELKNKKFTKEISNLNKEQILNILGGYFDSDGYLDKKNQLVANNASKSMSEQIYIMLLMAGINTSIKKYNCSQTNYYNQKYSKYYKIVISSLDINKIKSYMKSNKILNNFEYNRSNKILSFFIKDDNGIKYFAKSIKALTMFKYTGNAYDIQINPERSYVCSGFKISNCRFFSQNEPTIAASLRFYSQFPFHGFDNIINDPIRKEHFDQLKKRLNLVELLPQIAHEYFAMGDVFPFISIACSECGGIGTKEDGSVCHHEGGYIGNVNILNPDWVDVQINPVMPNDPIVRLIPDDTIKQIVFSKNPPEIYEQIPVALRQMILSNQPIPLSNKSVHHMKHDAIPYQAYGRSIIAPLFPTLAYQDKLRQAQWIVADRHILPIKICKIGSDNRPAGPGDISDTQSQLAALANDPNITLVTHHDFDFQWIGSSGKILQLTKEYDLIDSAIIKGLGVNEALLSGEGVSYSQAAIGIEATIKRLKTVQDKIGNWICEKIYKLEAQMNGFYKTNLKGEKVLDYPSIRWDDLNLRDKSQQNQLYMQLWDKKIVSTQFICEQLDIDYDVETERVRLETQYQQQLGIGTEEEAGGLGGGFGGGGGGLLGGGGGGGSMPGGSDSLGLPGDDIAPSVSGGEGSSGSPSGGEPMAAYETQLKHYNKAKDYAPSIHRPNKYKNLKKEPKKPTVPDQIEEQYNYIGPRTGIGRLTDIEQILYKKVEEAQKSGNLPLDFIWQQKPEPVRESRLIVDGLFPSVKLILQADGKRWHSQPDDIEKDNNIDERLKRLGWTVLRFTEDELKYSANECLAKIIDVYNKLKNNNMSTISSSNNEDIESNIDIEKSFLKTAKKNNYSKTY